MATLKQVIDSTAALRGKSYPEIADWLGGADLVANPVKTAEMVPAPIELKAIWQLVPSAERVKVRAMASFVQELRDAITLQDRETLGMLLEDALQAGALSPATAAKLQPLLTAKELDKSWSAQIPGPARWQSAGLAAAPSAADVQAAAHGG